MFWDHFLEFENSTFFFVTAIWFSKDRDRPEKGKIANWKKSGFKKNDENADHQDFLLQT